ncbi:hypothetical protein ACQKOE_13025 [Novosphingobium sp. NPDC080210]|uniref:hypothetical protein n=1 Tax=Novosphingobium sp. NPDC080210 TaxID=3390596 RepID=UPI003D078C93
MTWSKILSREQGTMADTWTEYLCAKPANDGFVLGVCIYEIVDYIPGEWFDDDGEPLPEFRDAKGDLVLPAEFNGRPIEGHDGEWLLGPLDQWNNEETAYVTELSHSSVAEALEILDWKISEANEVLSALHSLASEPK